MRPGAASFSGEISQPKRQQTIDFWRFLNILRRNE
jgi:hypothetical protein